MHNLVCFSSFFMPLTEGVDSFTDLLWIVAINDFMLKFIAVIVKIGAVLLPASILLHRKRVSFLLFL